MLLAARTGRRGTGDILPSSTLNAAGHCCHGDNWSKFEVEFGNVCEEPGRGHGLDGPQLPVGLLEARCEADSTNRSVFVSLFLSLLICHQTRPRVLRHGVVFGGREESLEGLESLESRGTK